MIFDTVSRNFNLTINDLSYGRIKGISDGFSIKNYSYRDSLTNLNDWISYYYFMVNFLDWMNLLMSLTTKSHIF